jgi:hypothetical protein
MLVGAPTAGAEVIQTVDTISVVGIGRVAISPSANAVEADSVYHQALTQAAGDGLAKARLLAGATGARVGAVEAISERGAKSVQCKDSAGESATYKGSEPDAGVAEAPTIAVKPTIPPRPAIPARAPAKKRKTRKGTERKARRIIAHKAENTAATCELSTEVSLIYGLEV